MNSKLVLYNVKGSSITIDTTCENDFVPLQNEAPEFYQSFIHPGDLVFDVGANAGPKTDQFLSCQAHVVCFEPMPYCLQLLRTKYQTDSRVKIEPLGLGAREEEKEMFICLEASTISTLSWEFMISSRFTDHGYRWTHKISIQLTTLDRMISKYGTPNFCKIDVENYELEVFEGLTSRIPLISFECNSDQFKTTKQCLEYLQKLGYREFNFAPAERGLFLFPQWISAAELIMNIENVMATVDFTSIWGLWGDVYAR